MDNLLPNELEELIVCCCCHMPFNDSDAQPKLLACRHYFCLKCISTVLLKGKELYCIHCWKRTELSSQPDMKPESLPTYNAILYLSQNMINIKTKKIMNLDKNQFSPTNISNSLASKIRSNENCLTHAMPNSLWCLKCNVLVCRACASNEDHRNHTVKSLNEAKETIHNDILSELIKMQKKLTELQHLVFKQRDFLLKILESCTTLKTQIETELINHVPTLEISEIRSNLSKAKLTLTLLEHQPSPSEAHRLLTSLSIEKQRLQTKYNEMILQCKLEEIIQNYGSLVDFDALKQISTALNATSSNGVASSVVIDNNISAASITTNANNNTNDNQIILNSTNNNHISITSNNLTVINNNNSSGSVKNNNSSSTSTTPTQMSCSGSSANGSIASNFSGTSSGGSSGNGNNFICHSNMNLMLANYCISQLYSHHILTTKTLALSNASSKSLTTINNNHNGHANNNNNNNNNIITSSSSSSSSNNNNNNIILGGLGMLGMLPEQMNQLSMSEHIMQNKYSSIETSNTSTTSQAAAAFLAADLLGSLNLGQHIGNGNVGGNYRQIHHHTPPPLNFIPDLNSMVMSHSLHSTSNGGNGIVNQSSSSSNTNNITVSSQPTIASIVQNPSVHVYPIYFFNIEINGQPFGRILIEVRNDVAPKMAKNFGSLATGEVGFGYKGCHIFQCWENESIITGDFELNNGRGGRSVFEDSFFMPDDTKILAIRGSVGMRRSQKRHDNLGLVGSQFRIILREMRGFTGIFAFVVEGLDLVDKISKAGDSAGKPQSNVIIVNCGKWQ
jgi:cyclophilin family peptidyl-prolyl cis-trans isomerase